MLKLIKVIFLTLNIQLFAINQEKSITLKSVQEYETNKITCTSYQQSLNFYKNKCLCFFNYVLKGNIETVKHYLSSGFDINTRDIFGFTALMLATLANNVEMAKFLIANNANLNAQILPGNSSKIGYVVFLFDKKIEINLKDEIGNTALHFAAIHNHPKLITLLLNAGASINIKNKKGKTFIDYLHEPAKALALQAYQEYKEKLEKQLDEETNLIPDLVNIVNSYL